MTPLADVPDLTIQVLYTCRRCGIVRAPVAVTARAPGEPIVAWMEALQYRLSADHRRRSPGCHPPTLTEVMIPMTGTDRVGGPSVQ